MPERREYFIGAYSSDKNKGIFPLTYLLEEDRWILGDPIGDIENASYAAYNDKHKLYYLLDERESGRLASYRRSPDGKWRRLSVNLVKRVERPTVIMLIRLAAD